MNKFLFLTLTTFIIFLIKPISVSAQFCPDQNACLCGQYGYPACCEVEGPGGYNCGGGGTGTPAPGTHPGDYTPCVPVNCPENAVDPNKYVNHYQGDSRSMCTLGNAQYQSFQCDNYGNCAWWITNYSCCATGSFVECGPQPASGSEYVFLSKEVINSCEDEYDTYVSYNLSSATYLGQYGCHRGAGCWWDVLNYYDIHCIDVSDYTCACAPTCNIVAPSQPTLLSPSNGGSVSNTSVSLIWDILSETWGDSCTTNTNQFEVYIGTSPSNLALVGTVSSSTGSVAFEGEVGITYYWKVRAKNGSANTDSNVWSFTINNGPWWQVKDGDITSNYDISSSVPDTKLFATVGLGGFSGVPVYGANFNLSSEVTKISTAQWHSNTTTTQSRMFNYAFFDNLIPSDVNFNDVSDLVSGGTQYSDGYEWYRANGDVSTSGDINIGNRKIILFIENGNFNINGKINLTDGLGFFGVFVDGDINIDPAISGSPSLEGIYLSNDSFSTGAGTSQLHIRGSVASFGSTNLQRDLSDNLSPAELFEFAPDQMLLFPEKLMFRRTKWTEVAP